MSLPMGKKPDEENLPPLTILVAEDEQTNYLLIELLVEPYNCKLLHASDGKEAVDLAVNKEIDIVLIDLKMPVLDGFDATKLIKKLRPNLPVIAISAYAFNNDQDKAYSAGCDGFISKPFEKTELIQTISRHVCLY